MIDERLQYDRTFHMDPAVIAYRKQREREEAQRRSDEELGRRRSARTPRS